MRVCYSHFIFFVLIMDLFICVCACEFPCVFSFFFSDRKFSTGESGSIMDRVFALYLTNVGSISDTPYGLPSPHQK